MFEEFTDQARKIMDLAHEGGVTASTIDMSGRNHRSLLALKPRRDRAPALECGQIRSFGVEAGNVRLEIEKLVTRGPGPAATGQAPLTPRAKRVIEYAREEARLVNQKLVGLRNICSWGCFASRTGLPLRPFSISG